MNVAGVFVSFPRDDRLAIFDLGAVVVWNASSGDALYRLASDSPVGSIAVSPQGDVVATCDGIHIVLWDAGTGARLASTAGEGTYAPLAAMYAAMLRMKSRVGWSLVSAVFEARCAGESELSLCERDVERRAPSPQNW